MTRKDYRLIAGALRESYKVGNYNAPELIADALATDNPRFDRDFFLQVVRGEKPLNARP